MSKVPKKIFKFEYGEPKMSLDLAKELLNFGLYFESDESYIEHGVEYPAPCFNIVLEYLMKKFDIHFDFLSIRGSMSRSYKFIVYDYELFPGSKYIDEKNYEDYYEMIEQAIFTAIDYLYNKKNKI